MFSSEQWLANSGGDFYNGVISQSLRLDRASSYNFNRQIGTVTSVTGTICTYSFWFKHTNKGTVMPVYMMCRDNQGSGNYSALWGYDVAYGGTQHLAFLGDSSSGSPKVGTNTSVFPFRDPSAWYHMVVRMDTTQSTASNRIRIYINGVDYAPNYTSPDYGGLDVVNPYWNNTGEWQIIGGDGGNVGTMDGYIAECNWIDGQSLPPESFGILKNGVWIPIEYSGTYGAQGWRLNFSNSSNIGADSSGNGNNFTTTTNLVASDIALDSPENNFCTWNPLSKSSDVTLTEGNLKAQAGEAYSNNPVKGTMAIPLTGKWYWEIRLVTLGYLDQIGIADDFKKMVDSNDGSAEGRFWGFGTWFNANNSSVSKYQVNAGSSSGTNWTGVAVPQAGDILMVAYDADNGTLWFGKNGSWYNSSGTANPATNTDPRFSSLTGHEWFAWYAGNGHNSASIYIANFGQDASFAGAITAGTETDGTGAFFKYAPPSGFLSLSSKNLPEPTIGANSLTQADDHFNTVLYTGTGSSNAITGVGFQTDWLWIKRRNGATSHRVFDSTRANGLFLSTDTTNAEDDGSTIFTSFDSDGFTVKGTSNSTNGSSQTYVAWNWKANSGTTSSNTDGSITSTVQANTDAGFSIVTYTGRAGQTDTIGHGLGGVVPDMYIVKRREAFGTPNWAVYHKGTDASSPQNYFTRLDTNAGRQASSTIWNNTAPTSSVFSVGTSNLSNYNQTFVAYCFADVEGYSKFGSYTGNGSADGTFVYTGFRPAYVMVKRTDSTGSWFMMDDKRLGYNANNYRLMADGTNVEYSGASSNIIDIISNGFKCRVTSANANASGGTYIYMAFGDSTKYANAR
tara:strand:- start:9233 stop:11773 length:2541 start_codon:yes stop_codon:yes gene_type:complete